MSSLYSCKKLIKYFYKTKVFENISFDIEKNSIFQIKGQNGTGKTTLLKIIAGLDTDFEGNVLYKNSKLFVIPDCGHVVNVEKSNIFNIKMFEFLNNSS